MKTKHLTNSIIGIILLAIMLSACGSSTANSAADLGGKTWVLQTIGGKPTLADTRVTLEFNFDESAIGGHSGCNSYFADFEIKGEQLTFSPIGATLMACAEPERMEQESAYMQALSGVSSYAIVDGQLQLSSGDGVVLIFKAE